MKPELTNKDLKFLEQIQLLQSTDPVAYKNIEFLIEGILIGSKLNKCKKQNEQ